MRGSADREGRARAIPVEYCTAGRQAGRQQKCSTHWVDWWVGENWGPKSPPGFCTERDTPLCEADSVLPLLCLFLCLLCPIKNTRTLCFAPHCFAPLFSEGDDEALRSSPIPKHRVSDGPVDVSEAAREYRETISPPRESQLTSSRSAILNITSSFWIR